MNQVTEAQAAELNEAAYTILAANLTGFGSTITPRHELALRAVLSRMTALAAGHAAGRWAYDLPCGAGKTQAIVAWCAAVERLCLPLHCMVAASKVEALCDLKRELVANGVAPDRIGLMHSYSFDPAKAEAARRGDEAAQRFASEPATTGNDQRPFLFVTHSRVRNAAPALQDWHYEGAIRKLVIWDESLLVSQGRSMTIRDVRRAAGVLGADASASNATPETVAAHQRFAAIVAELDAELRSQKDREPRRLFLEPMADGELDRLGALLAGDPLLEPLRDLLDVISFPLRVVRCSDGGGGLITYDIVVPAELRNVVVLDASYPIRELVTCDPTIRQDQTFDGRIKTYEEVTVHQMFERSSRTAMNRDFAPRRERRKLSQDIVAVVNKIAAAEGVIFFTFRPRGGQPNFASQLRADLKASGIEVGATVQDHLGRDRPRFVWLTWGQETTLSEYQYCSNVICAGTLQRSQSDIASQLAGQSNDLLLRMRPRDLKRVIQSEMVHCLYQAMNRGSARLTRDGRAPKMNVWLLHPDVTIREPLDRVMPGLNWRPWGSEGISQLKARATAEGIKAELSKLPKPRAISTRMLKAAMASNVHPSTFARALDLAVAELPGWVRSGRSVVPVNHQGQ